MTKIHSGAVSLSLLLAACLPAFARLPVAQDLSHFLSPGCRGDQTSGIALGDVDGDGRLDMVFGNGRHTPQPNLLFISGNRTDLFFPPRELGNSATYEVVLADVNGDKHLDLVEGNDTGYPSVVWINDGRGNFSAEYFFGRDEPTRDIAVGDLTGDGFPEIVTANRGATNRVYLNDGTGRFPQSRPLPVERDRSVAVELGDFNGDGRLDIVVANLGEHPNYLYLNDGAGGFPSAMPFGPADDESVELAVGDLNGDGNADVVVGNCHCEQLDPSTQRRGQPDRIFFGDGKGRFLRSITFGSGAGLTRAIAIGDINGDAAPDVVVGYEALDTVALVSDGATWWESRGKVLYLSRYIEEPNRVFLNDGKGNFRPGPILGVPRPTRALALGDMDGDGRLDIVVGTNCGGSAIHFNRGSSLRPR
jgi:hypothetical protein